MGIRHWARSLANAKVRHWDSKERERERKRKRVNERERERLRTAEREHESHATGIHRGFFLPIRSCIGTSTTRRLGRSRTKERA